MYYSQAILDEIRSSVDIKDVVGQYVKLEKAGSTYKGLCPFHKEKTPSFTVRPSKGLYHCFGCGASGDAIKFLQTYSGLSFPDAVKELARMGGVNLPEKELTEEEKRESRKKQVLLDINKSAAMYYFRVLRSPYGAEAYDYLSGRQLSDATMDHFGLGYADGCVCKYLRSKGFHDDDIIEAGLGRFSEKYGLQDVFWKRAMFPIQDISGRVIGFGGRAMTDDKKVPKYLNSKETPVFEKGRNLYGLHLAKKAGKGRLILCEGYMDVIAMHQAGFTEAVASLGTAMTSMHASIIKKYVKEVILSYDSDEAGQRACLKNIGILREAGLPSRVLHLEPYKDPDEFIKNLGAQAFEERLKASERSFFYEVSVISKNYDLSDPAENAAYLQDVAVRLSAFRNSLERESYLAAISEKFSIPREILTGAVKDTILKAEEKAKEKDDFKSMYRSDMESILGGSRKPGALPKASNKDYERPTAPAAKPETLQKTAPVTAPTDESIQRDISDDALPVPVDVSEWDVHSLSQFFLFTVLDGSDYGKKLFVRLEACLSPDEFSTPMKQYAALIWTVKGDVRLLSKQHKKAFDDFLEKNIKGWLDTLADEKNRMSAEEFAGSFKDETIRNVPEERKALEMCKKDLFIQIVREILPETW